MKNRNRQFRREPRRRSSSKATPKAPPKGYHFRTAFEKTRDAILSGCPDKGICLHRLKRHGNGEWHAALDRFLAFLVEAGHVIIDEVRARIKPIKLAGAGFYDQVMPEFALAPA